MYKRVLPYISCSSMGSSSRLSSSESDDGALSKSTGARGRADVKIPAYSDLRVTVGRNRVGRSAALRIVGFEFWISAMMEIGVTKDQGRECKSQGVLVKWSSVAKMRGKENCDNVIRFSYQVQLSSSRARPR